MNKARITYRFDQDKEQFDRLAATGTDDKQRTSTSGVNNVNNRDGMVAEDKTVLDDDLSHSKSQHNQDEIFDSQLLNQFTTDYGAWSSPFDIEAERLEQIIRDSDNDRKNGHGGRDDQLGRDNHVDHDLRDYDTGNRVDRLLAEREDLAGDLDWAQGRTDRDRDLLDETPIIIDDEVRSHYSTASYRTGRLSWFRIVTSVAGAIATGVLFGLFIMQMFTNLAINPDAPPASVPQDLQGAVTQPPGEEPNVETVGDWISVQIPEQTLYMLQFGVFSTLEGAKAAEQQLRQAGIASAYEAGESHVVFAGLTPDRNSALLLSNQLEELKLETYVKPFSRPEVSSLRWGNADSGQVESYFIQGADLSRTVSLLTLIHLEETVLTNFEDATMQALTASHQQWTLTANQISADVPEIGETKFEQMNNELTTAVNSLQEYKKNPSVSYLWQAQAAVMNYAILEKDLLQELSVQ